MGSQKILVKWILLPFYLLIRLLMGRRKHIPKIRRLRQNGIINLLAPDNLECARKTHWTHITLLLKLSSAATHTLSSFFTNLFTKLYKFPVRKTNRAVYWLGNFSFYTSSLEWMMDSEWLSTSPEWDFRHWWDKITYCFFKQISRLMTEDMM